MDFTSISNINSYLKSMNMNNIWKQKANNPISYSQNGMSNTSEQMNSSTSSFGDERLTSIITKMQSGQELSVDDMEYLREKYPETYTEAVKMEKEKKTYEKALKRCKTKEEARALQMGKVSEAMSALKSGAVDSKVVLAKLIKMTEVYIKFTESKQYSKLANNHTELNERIKAEKERNSGKEETKVERKENENNKPKMDKEINEINKQHNHEEKSSIIDNSVPGNDALDNKRFDNIKSGNDKDTEKYEYDYAQKYIDHKQKHIETENPVSDIEYKTVRLPNDSIPVFATVNIEASKTINESSDFEFNGRNTSDFEPSDKASYNKLDRTI